MSTTNVAPLTAEQYRALQRPITLPSPRQLFYQIVETLVAKKLASYKDADPFRKQLPQGLFLLVPPQPKELDLNHLVSLIEVKGKNGQNDLDSQYLKDEIEVPAGFYFMVDIEDGKARLNTKPSASLENILKEGRSPYTTWRGIVHAVVFPEVLEDHNIHLCGSRYGPEHVPRLSLFGGKPKLFAYLRDYASPEWGAPSCGSVLVL